MATITLLNVALDSQQVGDLYTSIGSNEEIKINRSLPQVQAMPSLLNLIGQGKLSVVSTELGYEESVWFQAGLLFPYQTGSYSPANPTTIGYIKASNPGAIGGYINVVAGAGADANATLSGMSGGVLTLSSGAGGDGSATSSTGSGAPLFINGGSAGVDTGGGGAQGGSITIQAGNGSNPTSGGDWTGDGGGVSLIGGIGSSGGAISLTAGSARSAGQYGGSILLNAGANQNYPNLVGSIRIGMDNNEDVLVGGGAQFHLGLRITTSGAPPTAAVEHLGRLWVTPGSGAPDVVQICIGNGSGGYTWKTL